MGTGRSGSHVYIESNFGATLALLFEYIRALLMPKITECVPHAFTYNNWSSTEGFIPLIGLMPLLCLFKYRKIITESKWLIPLLITLFIFYLTPLNNLFSLFTNIGYTRWLYGFTLFLALAFVISISSHRITKTIYWIYVVLSSGFVFALVGFTIYINRRNCYNLNWREIIELGLFILNIVLLGVYIYKAQTVNGFIKLFSVSATIQFACVIAVIFYNGSYKCTAVYFNALQHGTLPYANELFQHRTDFNCEYRNCGLIENRPSTMSYHSVSNKQFDDFRLLVSGNNIRPEMYVTHNRVSVDALLSVKDFIDYRIGNPEVEPMDTSAIVLVKKGHLSDKYAFNYYIPMGFSYDNYITKEEFDQYLKTQPTDSVLPLLDNLVIDSKDVSVLSKYLKHGMIKSNVALDSLVYERKKNVATSFVGDTRGFKMVTNFNSDRVVFISVVADPGFKATIDDQVSPVYKVNLGMSAIVVPKGKHNIDFDYTPPGLRLGTLLSVIAIILLIIIANYERRNMNIYIKKSDSHE
jgi:hypothetical protein